MLNKYFLAILALLLFSAAAVSRALAEDTVIPCVQLQEKASGALAKYSLYGDANGPVYFSGISCAIEHRNKVLCATEMVSFDATSKVFDNNTGQEIDIGKAYFWLDTGNSKPPILAFTSREEAEEYAAETEGGRVMDFDGLIAR